MVSELQIRVLFGISGAREAYRNSDIAVVIDVLRAASTITTALSNGAKSVIVVKEIDQALRLSRKYRDSILAGERRGIKISGFNLNNSPLEFRKSIVEGKTIIFTSSNCAPIVEELKGCPLMMLACFLNLSSAALYARRVAERLGRNVAIIHAGRYGKPSSDDMFCAEVLRALIRGDIKSPPPTDLVKEFLKYTSAGIYLSSIGRSDDVEYCGNVDLLNVVPIWTENGFIGSSV